MYLPLAAEGLARTMDEMTVVAFSTSFSGGKLSLPTGTCTRLVLSARNSTLPALISLTAEATSRVTVPVLGFGIRPLGPSTLPRRPTTFIMSGVAISASKAVQFSFWIFSTISSPPTKSAPAAVASFWRSPEAITATVLVLPSPCGNPTVPLAIWSAWRVSTPSRIVRSTVSSNLAYFTCFSRPTASGSGYTGLTTAARAFVIFLLVLAIHPSSPTVPASPALRRVWRCWPHGQRFLRPPFATPSNKPRNRGAIDGPGIPPRTVIRIITKRHGNCKPGPQINRRVSNIFEDRFFGNALVGGNAGKNRVQSPDS